METNGITPPNAATQVCKCCGRELPIEQFSRGGFGLQKTCKECIVKQRKERHKNAEEIAELRRQLEGARRLRLSEFKPRELMIALKELGYEGKLTYVERHEIDITKIE